MPSLPNPAPAPNAAVEAPLFGPELKQWLVTQGQKTVTLVVRCAPAGILDAPADRLDAGRLTWFDYLNWWLHKRDPERGQIIGPPFYGRIEIECRADVAPQLSDFPFLKQVVHRFVDDPEADSEGKCDPELLYPFRSAARDLQSSRLVAAIDQLTDPMGDTAFGPVAYAVRKLAQNEDPNGQAAAELQAWIKASKELIRAAGGTGEAELLSPTATELAKRLLDKAVADLGASGYMMCVRDPATSEDYRVILAEGIKYREMLVGFSGFGSAHWEFSDEDEVYCTNQNEAFLKLPKNRWFIGKGKKQWVAYARMLENPKKRMYGPYFVREGLQGLVYLQGWHKQKRCFSVYLNFTQRVAFGNRVRAYLRNLKVNLTRLYDRFCEEFCAPVDAQRANKLLQTAHDLTALSNDPKKPEASFEQALGECFTKFLKTAIEILGFPTTDGFATLSGFNAGQFLLYPVAWVGTIEPKKPEDAAHLKYQAALLCDGVVSWVALHRRPILIPDVNAEHIRGFAKQIDSRVQSEMALPMLAGDELLGVLNFECFHPNAFTKSHMILMSLVANSIALAWRECLRRRLIYDLAQMSIIVRSPDPVVAWYNAVQKTFRANDMSLWKVSRSISGNTNFLSVSPHVGKCKPNPRANGWTNCIAETRQIICLTDTNQENMSDFKVLLWKEGGWVVPTEEKDLPTSVDGARLPLNPALLGGPMLCLIGIPLVEPVDNQDRCIGVLWLKYWDKPPDTMFDSPLIRDAFLVPFTVSTNAPQSVGPDLVAEPLPIVSMRPNGPYYPVINPKLMPELLEGFRYSSLAVRIYI
ncbi:GAF domain-containing protein [Frigoriglobus tundricola]|uniref:GAF domain-containing protein n=1 Tax=Frigoriglobus tundricola TaxID=2774151 RepID=A0A6M5YV37_9BACT|nr:GAF domain-containing protein [Frigoriglobus tundricola]QJW97266.1 hypothetical protein FTUN_4836 [Frigoriglobus tundricola]